MNKLVADLQSGTVDGQENPLSAIWLDDFYRGQKYLSLTGYVYFSHIGAANLKWFRYFPENDRRHIRESIEEVAHYHKRWSRQNESTFLAKIKGAGITLDEKPDLDSFKKKASLLQQDLIFREKNVRELLQKFLKATNAPGNSH